MIYELEKYKLKWFVGFIEELHQEIHIKLNNYCIIIQAELYTVLKVAELVISIEILIYVDGRK